MKKILISLSLLLTGLVAGAQSIKFGDLLYITPMTNDDAYATLRSGGVFKQDYSEQVDGYPMEYFRRNGAKPDQERIATGRFTRLYNGTVLRTLDYTSTDIQGILNLVSQARYYE